METEGDAGWLEILFNLQKSSSVSHINTSVFLAVKAKGVEDEIDKVEEMNTEQERKEQEAKRGEFTRSGLYLYIFASVDLCF